MTQKLLLSEEWHLLLGNLIAAIGDDQFCESLAAPCETLTGYDSTFILAFVRNRKPRLLYNSLNGDDESSSLIPYFDGAYLLDPFYNLYKSGAADGAYRLKEVRPEFYENKYYQSFYPQIVDETGLLIQISPEIHIAIACGVQEGNAPREFQIQELRKLFPILSAACQQHWSRENQLTPLLKKGESSGEFGATLETAFENFGKDYLTQREREILHLILKGYSSKSIAQLLEISVDTVKVHRKRFHSKLEVSSQAELFALFLDAISMVPLGSTNDPLSYYYESQEMSRLPEEN